MKIGFVYGEVSFFDCQYNLEFRQVKNKVYFRTVPKIELVYKKNRMEEF